MDFNNDQKFNLLSKMGYTGPSDSPAMEAFIQSNPGVAARMGKFTRVLRSRVGMADGGTTTINTTTLPTTTPTTAATTTSPGLVLSDALIQDPNNLLTKPEVATVSADTAGTNLAEGVGQVSDAVKTNVTTADTAAATAPTPISAATVAAQTAAPQVSQAVEGVTGVQGQVSDQALTTAAQQTESSISNMQGQQGTAYLMDNPVTRAVESGELISGSAVDAAKVNEMVSSIQAAEATPSQKATVQGQLEGLMTQFEGGQTPAWAAGAMRNAQAMLAARGIGASSMAGQAVIQAAMESALPIAQADAATVAQFESMNLSNRQQSAMFAAQQRAAFLQQDFDQAFQTRVANAAKISDIANMNFTAEQNIAMENSRAVNTMNLTNLSNSQAMTMAQAAALSQLDISNLNNRQQAAVQNAQAFLQMDMTNVSNAQQAEMFRAQSNVQALFTDQAAINAANQFNAASENQTNQFFADLATRVGMFNTEQQNAIAQFNAGQTNAAENFNAQLEAQRQQFNAQNSLVIAQANAVWRQSVVTTNTAAQNDANMEAAKTANALTAKALDEIWQRERDIMAYTFTGTQSDLDRAQELLLADKTAASVDKQTAAAESGARASFFTKLILGW